MNSDSNGLVKKRRHLTCDFQNVVKEEDEELNRLLAQDVDAKPEKVLGDDTGHLPYTIFRKKINKSVFNFKQM